MEFCKKYSEIKCPHCGELNDTDAEMVPWTDYGEETLWCQKCNERFFIRADITINWTTHKDEDDE